MKFNVKQGDLLAVNTGCILHGCNAQGVMGAGVALAFKNKYPAAYIRYVQDLDIKQFHIKLGGVSWYTTPDSTLTLCSAITQQGFGRSGNRYVSYDAVASCFSEIFDWYSGFMIDFHLPKIGAGLGGGSWEVIEQIIIDRAKVYDVSLDRITVWEL